MRNAFHGRTFATISAGGNPKVQAGFEPLMPGFLRVPYNDIQALEELAATEKNIAAVLLEPIQGEGGILVPSPHYLKQVRALCTQQNWLMAIDEIQTGMGRTGHLFAYQEENIKPDIITVAKGLANGIPIGACLATNEVSALFQPGNHGSTFGGNPLACRTAVTTLKVVEEHKLWENAAKQGQRLLEGLKNKLRNNSHVLEVRGKGLMIGIALDKPCRDILALGLKKNLLFNITNETVIRLLPPLIIENEHVEIILNTLPELINDFTS